MAKYINKVISIFGKCIVLLCCLAGIALFYILAFNPYIIYDKEQSQYYISSTKEYGRDDILKIDDLKDMNGKKVGLCVEYFPSENESAVFIKANQYCDYYDCQYIQSTYFYKKEKTSYKDYILEVRYSSMQYTDDVDKDTYAKDIYTTYHLYKGNVHYMGYGPMLSGIDGDEDLSFYENKLKEEIIYTIETYILNPNSECYVG